MVIHGHDTLPPVLTAEPCSYAGATGMYWPATPAGARQALAWHRRNFGDWEPDPRVVELAGEDAV